MSDEDIKNVLKRIIGEELDSPKLRHLIRRIVREEIQSMFARLASPEAEVNKGYALLREDSGYLGYYDNRFRLGRRYPGYFS